MTPDDRARYEAQREEIEAAMAKHQEDLDWLNQKLETAPDDFGDEDISNLDSDIVLVRLEIRADGSYHVEWFCSVNDLLYHAAESVKSMAKHRDEMEAEGRRRGYER